MAEYEEFESQVEDFIADWNDVPWGEWQDLMGELTQLLAEIESATTEADADFYRGELQDWLDAYDIDVESFDWEAFREAYGEST